MLYSPWKVALLGLLVWIAVRFTAPFEPKVPLSIGALGYIGACYVTFLVGCLIAELSRSPQVEARINSTINPWDGPFQTRVFWLSVMVGISGIMARVIDRVVFRGVAYGEDSATIRDALANSDITPLAALGSALLPFCFIPLILVLGSRPTARGGIYMVIAIAMFALPALESLGQLSRSVLIISAILALFSVACLRFKGKIINAKVFFGILAFVAVGLPLSTALFSQRTADSGRDLNESLAQSAYTEQFYLPADTLRATQYGGEAEKAFYKSTIPNQMYYVHGLYEFDILWNRPDDQPHSWGLLTFQPYYRVATLLFPGLKLDRMEKDMLFPRVGIFMSFFGVWWVEFWYLGIPLLFLIGVGVSRLADYARLGHINAFPLYMFCIVIIFLMPVENMASLGVGFFMLHGFALFALFTSFTPSAAQIHAEDDAAAEPQRA